MSRKRVAEALVNRRPTPSGMSIVKRVRTDEIQLEKIVSETDEQISRLAHNQSKVEADIYDIRQGFKSFTTPATYKQSLRDVSGSRTLTEYSNHECDESHIQSLRDCGLTDQEIHLWLQYGHTEGYVELPSSSKMNPEAHNLRIEEIKTKIDNHKSELLKERGFSSAQTMSRHAMELEVVLNRGRAEQKILSQLVVKSRSSELEDTPESQLKSIAQDLSDKPIPIPDYGDPFPNPWTPVTTPKLTPSLEFVGPKEKDPGLDVSDDQIFKNRLSKSDISRIPKFDSYTPGEPSEVLYVKNLATGVKYEHLIHLFGRFRIPGDRPITCKLMSGRMRGQAFITCADTETASRCMLGVHGYKLKGKPMVISYGKSKPKLIGAEPYPASICETSVSTDLQNKASHPQPVLPSSSIQ